MKIVVCIKQVPDTNEVKLDPKTNRLIRDGVPSIINHDDKSGIEAALQLREKVGGTVTVVCMGPPQADVALREALAMGCDDAYLLSAREFGGSDTCATAIIISTALKKIGYDLVITGRQAIDGDTAQVGPQIAENLGIPQVSYAEVVDIAGDVVTALQELAEPRYMHAGGIIDAYEKEIKVFGFDDLKDDLNPDFIGLNGSPTKVVTSFGKMAKGAGTKLEVGADEAVAAIIAKMEERHII